MDLKFIIRLFMPCILFQACMMSEPKGCSRFSYEISALERVIKSEMRVEEIGRDVHKTEESIQNTQTAVTNMIEDLKRQSAEMEETFREKQAKMEATFKEQSAEMEATFREKEAQIRRLSEDVEQINNKTESQLRDLAVTPVVQFRAKFKDDSFSGSISLSTDQILVFATTVVNTGDGYDDKTGHFTAPVAGMYHFTFQPCVSGQYMNFDMVVDDVIIKSATYRSSSTTCSSFDIGITMRKGMKTWLKTSSTSIMYEDRYRTIMFSGYLVYRLPQQ